MAERVSGRKGKLQRGRRLVGRWVGEAVEASMPGEEDEWCTLSHTPLPYRHPPPLPFARNVPPPTFHTFQAQTLNLLIV